VQVLAVGAALGAENQDGALVQVDQAPRQIAKLTGAQAVTISNQDGGGIAVTIPGVFPGDLL
jgi:hypothetical protein